MDAAFTAEQDAIRRTLNELLIAGVAGERRRELWHRLAEGLERAPLSPPLLATAVLAAPLIAALGSEEQRATLLPDIAAGRSSAALAVSGGALSVALGLTGDNTDGGWAGGGRSGGVQARRGEKGWVLYGQAEQVLDGHGADLLLVAAHTGGFARGRVLLFLVRAKDAVGLARVRQAAAEDARPQATLQLRYVEGELLGSGEGVAEALGAVGRAVAAVLAVEAVGAAERLLAGAAARAGGRARLAEVYAAVEAARSAAYRTVWHPADVGGGALALAQGLEALRAAAGEAMRGGGGDGVREAQGCFARVAGDEVLFGPVERLRAWAVEVSGVFGRTGGDGVTGTKEAV
ncbi:acyl-CoA dehydrogenase [Streptomyces sp. NPDC087440]|uniref:acyl-CoA dehydrogenase n=1 Tax=Streptomyces sp. NPDC087440 TaxID=3365790 RepID=UPI003825E813